MASRYHSYITTTTNTASSDSMSKSDPTYSRAITKSDRNNTETLNLTSMMKKLETKSHPGSSSKNRKPHEAKKLYIPGDVLAEDLKKNGGSRGGGFSNVQKNLLKGKKEGEVGSKALMEIKNVNGNSRNLAMVLMDSHIKKVMEKEISELSQAKQLILSLQMQVTSLEGQLQSLAEDLAKVKADKIYCGKGSSEANVMSPTLQEYYYTDKAANPQDFSTTPGIPDDLFEIDLNPRLTPYTQKTKPKDIYVYDSTEDELFSTRFNY